MQTRTLSAITGMGVSVFALVVFLLHLAQPGYNPRSQLMSELALGRFGGLLVVAFIGLFAATAATAANLQARNAPVFVVFLLGLAAINFLAAGMVTLATSIQIHVLFISIAFVACGLGMYLLPRAVPAFFRPLDHALSWGACLVMGGVTGLGGNLILSGIAQRISALTLLIWLLFVAWRLARIP